jgi:hypothetical protein
MSDNDHWSDPAPGHSQLNRVLPMAITLVHYLAIVRAVSGKPILADITVV